MTAPPFPGPPFAVHRAERNGLQWLMGIAGVLAMAFGLVILWGVFTQPLPEPPQVIAAPIVQTVVVVATITPTLTPAPTQTPLIVYRAATNTSTPAVLICETAPDGSVCVRLPSSPTPTPPPADCRFLTPISFQVQICRKGDGATSANQESS